MSDSSAMKKSLLLQGARLVTPGGVVEDASLLVRGELIAQLIRAGESEPGADEVFNLPGLILYPGFIDLHLHGAVGVDTMEASVEDLHRVSRFLAGQGVTGWMPTLVPAPDEDYARAVSVIEQLMREQHERPTSARVLGVHYEGPFINRAQCGALRPPYFRDYRSPADLDALATLKPERAAHMMTVAPEIDGGLELIRELRARGWIVSIGHTRATVEMLEGARAAGAQHMTHFLNAMSPLHHRAPGPIGWGLCCDEVSCDVIADGVHVDPLMLQLVWRCKGAERMALISDAIAPAGLGDGEYRIWGETIWVTGGRTQNARGSIAGSVITLREAVQMMHALGVRGEELALMSSRNAARLLGVDDRSGAIEAGKRADLVALDQEGNVRLTLIGGCVAMTK